MSDTLNINQLLKNEAQDSIVIVNPEETFDTKETLIINELIEESIEVEPIEIDPELDWADQSPDNLKNKNETDDNRANFGLEPRVNWLHVPAESFTDTNKNNQWDEGEEFIDGNENNQYDSADVVYAHDGTYAIFDTDDSKNERVHEQGIVSGEITDSIYVMVYNNGLESDKTQILSDDVNGVYETEQSWTHYNKEEGVWVPNFTNVDLDGDGIEEKWTEINPDAFSYYMHVIMNTPELKDLYEDELGSFVQGIDGRSIIHTEVIEDKIFVRSDKWMQMTANIRENGPTGSYSLFGDPDNAEWENFKFDYSYHDYVTKYIPFMEKLSYQEGMEEAKYQRMVLEEKGLSYFGQAGMPEQGLISFPLLELIAAGYVFGAEAIASTIGRPLFNYFKHGYSKPKKTTPPAITKPKIWQRQFPDIVKDVGKGAWNKARYLFTKDFLYNSPRYAAWGIAAGTGIKYAYGEINSIIQYNPLLFHKLYMSDDYYEQFEEMYKYEQIDIFGRPTPTEAKEVLYPEEQDLEEFPIVPSRNTKLDSLLQELD